MSAEISNNAVVEMLVQRTDLADEYVAKQTVNDRLFMECDRVDFELVLAQESENAEEVREKTEQAAEVHAQYDAAHVLFVEVRDRMRAYDERVRRVASV